MIKKYNFIKKPYINEILNNLKIAVYYIATGLYVQYFKGFLESLHNFFPDILKEVMLISDGLTEYDNYTEKNIHVNLCPRINHYPWPIITLYKFWHILLNFNNECDYHVYFNANCIIYKNDPNIWFKPNKLTVTHHWLCSYNKPLVSYSNGFHKSSAAYFNKEYSYILAAFFMGNSDIMKQCCHDICKMLLDDSKKFIYPEWHDESYLNKWVIDNNVKVNKQFILSPDRNKNAFIELIYHSFKKEFINDIML